MNRKKILIGSLVLIAALAISGFNGISINRSNTSHEEETRDLTTLDAAEISAFRWIAMAEFYANQNKSQGAVSGDLTTLNAADISAYRWNAMARYYQEQALLAKLDPTK